MADNEDRPDPSGGAEKGAAGFTRRDLIKRAAIVAGAAVWVAPAIRMAMGNGGPDTVSIGGAQLVFTGPCASVLLTDPTTTRTVCAKTLTSAKTAFKSAVTTECNAKCPAYGPCTTPNTCKTKATKGTTVGTITCTGPGPNCPVPPYATGTKEYVCTAVVTCVCVCRA